MEPLWSLRFRGSCGLGSAEQTGFVPSILRHRLGPSRTPSCGPPVARRLHGKRRGDRRTLSALTLTLRVPALGREDDADDVLYETSSLVRARSILRRMTAPIS